MAALREPEEAAPSNAYAEVLEAERRKCECWPRQPRQVLEAMWAGLPVVVGGWRTGERHPFVRLWPDGHADRLPREEWPSS